MKKFLALAAVMVICLGARSQPNNVVSAIKYLDDYLKSNEFSSLQKAKSRIDTAITHEKTKGEPKTWNYRGKIYQSLFENNFKSATDKITDESDQAKKVFRAYQNVQTKELEEAVNAFKKSKELDTKRVYTEDADMMLKRSLTHFENIGIAYYNAGKYSAALPAFEKVVEISGIFGKTDTVNLNNAALVSEKAKLYSQAIMYYNRLIELKFGGGQTYSRLAEVKLEQKDSSGAMEVIKKGRATYPDDANLLITETNFFLADNKQTLALENLKVAIQKDPKNANLYLVAGNVLDNIANPKDEKGRELSKPDNYDEMTGKAVEYYTKAIELKGDYFDALYNLGILFNNKGVFLAKKADSITNQTKYASEQKKAEEEFAKAIPLLEKAHGINPQDRNTMIALKQLYARTEQTDKMNQMNSKLKN